MKIYLTDLQAYNEGHLVGRWIKLPLTGFELAQALSEVLSEGEVICNSENHEEYFITDWECDYMDIEEYSDIYKLNEIAQDLEDINKYDMKRYTALRGHGNSHQEALKGYEDVDLYEDMTLTELAEEFVEDGYFGDIHNAIRNYIDYEAIARDLAYDYNEVDGDIVRVA